MSDKQRLSATVDRTLLDAGQAAVEAGEATSLSAWVNSALQRQADHDRQMRQLGTFLAEFQAKYGEITDDDIRSAQRAVRERAVLTGGEAPTRAPRRAAS